VSLRERKRVRTRQALVDAAVDLFERNGYERTTVADIAAAAEIGTRTFFSYFASKEELLFPEADVRIQAAIDAIATRRPGEGPAEVLLRALSTAGEASDDMTGRLARVRTRVMREIPAVMGRGLQVQLAGQREIARHLAAAFPDRLDLLSASAMAGAFVGAVTTVLLALLDDPAGSRDPAEIRNAMWRATETGLRQWGASPPSALPSPSEEPAS